MKTYLLVKGKDVVVVDDNTNLQPWLDAGYEKPDPVPAAKPKAKTKAPHKKTEVNDG